MCLHKEGVLPESSTQVKDLNVVSMAVHLMHDVFCAVLKQMGQNRAGEPQNSEKIHAGEPQE